MSIEHAPRNGNEEEDAALPDEREVINERMDKLDDPEHRRDLEEVVENLGIQIDWYNFLWCTSSVPVAPSKLDFLDDAEMDLGEIQSRNPDDAERIVKKIKQWREWIQFGRVPQEHLTYLTDSPPEYNFYRQYVGKSDYRVIYEISRDEMTVVAILPKDKDTYDMDTIIDRVKRWMNR